MSTDPVIYTSFKDKKYQGVHKKGKEWERQNCECVREKNRAKAKNGYFHVPKITWKLVEAYICERES